MRVRLAEAPNRGTHCGAPLRRTSRAASWSAALAVCASVLGAPAFGASASSSRSPFVGVGQKVLPAVVSIRTVRSVTRGGVDLNPLQEMFRRFFPGGREGSREALELPSTGSGFLFGSGRHVMTNHHVIAQADAIFVRFPGQTREHEATVVGTDPGTDLAVLRIEAAAEVPPLAFGDSDALAVGDWAIAIGNPFGNLEGSLTVGVVSAKGRSDLVISGGTPRYQDFIQTDASINFGNSGGPLVDIEGLVIGVNTAVNTGGQGIGFAVPSNLALWIGEQIVEHGRVRRGYLGVRTVDPGPEGDGRGGAVVAAVLDGSPAAAAGLAAGDVITAFAGRPVRSPHDLQFLVARSEPGARVELEILREGSRQAVGVALSEAAAEGETGRQQDWLGMEVASLQDPSPEVQRLRETLGLAPGPGVIVGSVEADGPAAAAGIRPGDVIVTMAGHEVPDLETYRRLQSELAGGREPVPVLVRTGKVESYVSVDPRPAGVEQ